MERRPLVQLDGVPLLSDGGLETTLVFHQGIELLGFAAFDLLRRERGAKLLAAYFRTYLALARATLPLLWEGLSRWRASPGSGG